MTPPATAPARARLLSTPVTVLWFAALLSWATGCALEIVGVTLEGTTPNSVGTSVSVLLGAAGLGVLYGRRGFDALTRIPAITAIIMAIASSVAAVGLLALLVIGPDRPIGVVDAQVGAIVAIATAAASASTVVLIRPYVDPMVAHVWAGIGGAGLALPFMIAGISPAAVVAGAIGLGVVDRVRGVRFEREVAFRKQLESDYATEHGDRGRGIGVSGLPGVPPALRAPRPHRPWALGERRATLRLGLAAILIVAAAWAAGTAAADSGILQDGQGFALAALGAVPLTAQIAILARAGRAVRSGLVIADGMLALATIALLSAPLAGPGDAIAIAAIALQSAAVAIVTGLIVRRASRTRLDSVIMLAMSAAIAWWLVVVPSGGLVLAFLAVVTTLVALRRKARP